MKRIKLYDILVFVIVYNYRYTNIISLLSNFQNNLRLLSHLKTILIMSYDVFIFNDNLTDQAYIKQYKTEKHLL